MAERSPLLALELPLKGRQLIEASAGTGKTWTLAALYVRLVLGHGRGGLTHGLWPPQILVMTFTDAATAELRDRIRVRLQEAVIAFAQTTQAPPDEFLAALWHDTPPQQRADAAQRLALAVSWMDEAAIHTIHGWSMKCLREHAFQSRSLFDVQRLENPDEVWLELARQHVRQFIYPLSETELQALHAEGLSARPQDWIEALREKRKAFERSPQAHVDLSGLLAPKALLQDMVAWLPQQNECLQNIRATFDLQLAHDIQAHKNQHPGVLGHLRSDLLPGLLTRVIDWAQGQEENIEIKDLDKLGYAQMVEKQWPVERRHPALLAIDEFKHLHKLKPTPVREALLDHALHHMLQAYRQLKDQAGLFDFHDLLQRLHQALDQEDRHLASLLRTQYPVALVDEFQDTDAWQYGILNRIYPPEHEAGTLILIGDPKQAIYSFRGADIDTYLQARRDVQQCDGHHTHSLRHNRRSEPELLSVLNRLFDQHPQLFGPDIQFEAALHPSDATPTASTAHHPVQAVVSEGWGHANAENHRLFLLQHMTQQMVDLLQNHQVQPNQMAVLVRSQHQAQEVLKALARSRIPAVFLSDRSRVYQTDEARDLWLLLRALAQPRRTSHMRAALGTSLWGLNETELIHLTHSDAAWDTLIEQALGWHQHWIHHGIFAMLRLWLLDTGAAGRWLAQPEGERKLTHVLHLGELLQQASHPMTSQGIATQPHATVRHLGQEISRAAEGEGPTQTRLESDEARVKVVTFHKSKGLQYPHVFIPFLSSGVGAPEHTKDDADGPQDRSQDVLEDTRLLYVAMTRAERSVWLGVYPHSKEFVAGKPSALCRWFQRPDAKSPWGPIWQDLSQHIAGLRVSVPEPVDFATWSPAPSPEMQGGPRPAPRLRIDPWWSASFSGLTRTLLDPTVQVHAPSSGADREVDTESLWIIQASEDLSPHAQTWQSFGAGARYGTVLHDLLQWQADRDWPLAGNGSSSAWRAMIERQSGLTDAEQAMITPWIQQIIQTPLPIEGAQDLVLADLKQPQHMAEMPFHFGVESFSIQRLDAMISADLFPGRARPSVLPATLRGMVNGFMDLVFEHDGRYWVLDYKSNWLEHYDPTSLQTALLEKRYDIQSVLYLLALHRLLKVRVPDYEPSQHLGGSVYLFIRGIGSPGQGVVMQQPSASLITSLDHALSGSDQGLA